ncbi:MAG: hypothetical protein R3321_07480 [Nitrososphaeraceae archaeon]|nr:hypothetical protein [Nitrososphaeraceae archaeon]
MKYDCKLSGNLAEQRRCLVTQDRQDNKRTRANALMRTQTQIRLMNEEA